jgi:Fe-S cluster assembly scaffold protein SufB
MAICAIGMAARSEARVTGKSGKAEQKAARQTRLSAALRENLKRRKAQARSRAQSGDRAGGAENTALSASGGTEPRVPDFRRNQGRD